MEGYLGETKLDSLVGTPYEKFGQAEWAVLFIGMYGQTDGSHHKQWTLDQVARILHGTPVIVRVAAWDNGSLEYRFETSEPSKSYLAWAEEMLGDRDYETGEFQFSYEIGIAP